MFIRLSSLSSVFYGAILLAFFLPFVQIRCNDQVLTQVNGVELATGIQMGNHQSESEIIDHDDFYLPGDQDQEQNYFALTALVLALCGLVLTFLMKWRREMLVAIIALAGALCLFIMRVQIDASVTQKEKTGSDQLMNIKVEVGYESGYWIVLILFLLIAVMNIYAYISQKKIPKMKISEGLPEQW